jgi:F0F1-type ATP synthase epsilon subunit
MRLRLEVITPTGLAFARNDLEQVVMRRKESRFELGSEVAVRPRHGALLLRLPDHVLRCRTDRGWLRLHVAGGFAEVLDDRVSILTPSAEELPTEPDGCEPRGPA